MSERCCFCLSNFFLANQLMAEADSYSSCVQQCVVKVREVLKDKVKEWEKEGGERERESKLILIASLTVSVGFSTLRSTRYKGKSGGEVRKKTQHLDILSHHCITDHIIHHATVCRPFWTMNQYTPSPGVPQACSAVLWELHITAVLWAGQSFYMVDLALVLYTAHVDDFWSLLQLGAHLFLFCM